MELPELRRQARSVVDDPALTYRQRMQRLAVLAENSLAPPPVSAECAEALEKRVICDLYEGNAPYRPRYVLPDYATFLRQGSTFLELGPARDLDEAFLSVWRRPHRYYVDSSRRIGRLWRAADREPVLVSRDAMAAELGAALLPRLAERAPYTDGRTPDPGPAPWHAAAQDGESPQST